MLSKKGGQALAGYDLSYYDDGSVTLTLCDKPSELKAEGAFTAHDAVKKDSWTYLAVAASHKEKKVTFYVGGKKVRERGGFDLGDISNRDNFNIAYNEYVANGQGHCLISQVAACGG